MPISKETIDKWSMKINICMESTDMNDWEVEFIDSLSLRRSQGRLLSMKQSQVLNKIYDKVSG